MKVALSALETQGQLDIKTQASVCSLGGESTRPHGGCQEHAQIITIACWKRGKAQRERG